MEGLFYFLLSDRQVTFVNMVIGVLLFIVLLFLFFCKSSRDERGRKIIGKASIVALICFGICATLCTGINFAGIRGSRLRIPAICLFVLQELGV